jgi:4-amino-4-deoxy-L-arabinose transferase-like glycosyltransferase
MAIRERPKADARRWRVGVALVVIVGLALRLWRLDAVPAALSHDEAYDALNAVQILDGARPLFFPSNNGREPLFMYVVALAFGLFGVGAVPLRLVAVVAGTATTAVVALVGRELFGRAAGLFAAALMALGFWPLFDSRLGLRAALLPLLSAAVVWGLARALRASEVRGVVGWAAAAGAAIGLAFDTYTPGRLLALLPLVLIGFHRRRLGLLGLAAAGLAAFVVALPLLGYFAAHPEDFLGRTDQVNDIRFILAEANPWPLVVDTLNTLGMFVVAGDPSSRYNLADRPVFDAVSGLMFYAGLAVCLRIIFSPHRPHPRAAPAALLLAALTVGLLPSAITGESPHFLRAVGAQPAIYLLAGIGGVYVFDALARQLEQRLEPSAAFAATRGCLALLLLGTGLLTYRDYFAAWADDPAARHIYEAAYRPVADRVLDAAAGRVFVSGEHPADLDRFVVDVLRGGRPNAATWFDARRSLVFPANGPATYAIPRWARPPDDLLRRYFGDSPLPGVELWTPRLDTPPTVAPAHVLQARLGDYLELIGYDPPPPTPVGQVARVTLYWRVLRPPPVDVSLFVHAIGELGSQWMQDDGLGYPRDGWRPGDVLVQWHELEVPVGTPPVTYQLEVGGYRRDDGARLPVQLATGTSDRLRLDTLSVETVADQPLPAAARALDVAFPAGIRLAGYELASETIARGRPFHLTLFWRSAATPAASYTVFAQLVGAEPRPVAQGDGPPAYGGYPTTVWQAGDLVRDPHEIPVPVALPSARYRLIVGLYRPETGQRLAPLADAPGPLDRLRAFLDRATPYRAPPRVDGDRVILASFDLGQ